MLLRQKEGEGGPEGTGEGTELRLRLVKKGRARVDSRGQHAEVWDACQQSLPTTVGLS